ncbi:hypothetical protein ACRALDRAFT_2022610 [Sodiomyces alcalophilus JCM 7366]|uniref:uncharacterized protein n=1 Tax=Sodiomyces alcalophilus JCM 7366 TaxID=591952 RepID=UPI0039B5B215
MAPTMWTCPSMRTCLPIQKSVTYVKIQVPSPTSPQPEAEEFAPSGERWSSSATTCLLTLVSQPLRSCYMEKEPTLSDVAEAVISRDGKQDKMTSTWKRKIAVGKLFSRAHISLSLSLSTSYPGPCSSISVWSSQLATEPMSLQNELPERIFTCGKRLWVW